MVSTLVCEALVLAQSSCLLTQVGLVQFTVIIFFGILHTQKKERVYHHWFWGSGLGCLAFLNKGDQFKGSMGTLNTLNSIWQLEIN